MTILTPQLPATGATPDQAPTAQGPDWTSLWLHRGVHPKPVPGTAMVEVHGVRGFLLPGDLDWLWNFTRSLPRGGVHVEVGSWMGLSAILCANALLSKLEFDSRIYCVDTWQGSEEHQSVPEVREDRLFHEFLTNVRASGVERFVRPLRGDSPRIAETFADASIDSVFIDGDHSYEGCLADLEAWVPKVRPGGRIAGHDATPDGGVRRAVLEFFATHFPDRSVAFVEPPNAHYVWELIARSPTP